LRLAARRDAIALRQSKTEQEHARSERPAAASKPGETGKLVRKADFDAVYRNGKRRSSSHFTVFQKANGLPQSRFGFSIKRALGGAVVRNRMRRRMREVVRLHRQEISAGWDFVIHPKANVKSAAFAALESDLLRLLKA
jgi:ribonuclease P protein component